MNNFHIFKIIRSFSYIFFYHFNIEETVTEEKVVEYVEDEIFSSSRRTSATASSNKAQAPLKPQTVEKDPASNYHPYEDNKNEESKDHARNNGEPAKETKNSRPSQENSQQITTTTPEPTTSNLFQSRQSTDGEKSNVDSLESSSEDPLYASDEQAKVCTLRL